MKLITLSAAIILGCLINVNYFGVDLMQSILLSEGFIGGFLCYHFTK
jgi:hypothetical protein